MYSLVIAEDELTTRRGLVHMVKWSEIGFQVDAEFSDGQELLEYLKTSMPDVILTDIKMSRVSGLDIARFAAEQNLPVQIVFLSGYKDFEYAQSAVEYHVLHYLVKPVSIPKLREVFTGVRELLDQQNALQNAMLNRVDHYQKLVNYQKQQFVLDALSGSLRDNKEAEERLKIVNILPAQPSRLLLVRIKIQKDRQYKGFLADYGRQELQEQITSILQGLDGQLEFYPVEWKEQEAEKSFCAIGVFWEKDEKQKEPTAIWKLKEQFQQELSRLTTIGAEIEVIKELSAPIQLLSCTESLNQSETIKEQSSAGIEAVMNYIQAHFCEDITLTDIANAVFLNPIYISRLIKEQTGKNYTDLLMEMRIGKAVSMLKTTDLYVYEIAEKTGYHNLKYFYKVFKKVTGGSPNDYRLKKGSRKK